MMDARAIRSMMWWALLAATALTTAPVQARHGATSARPAENPATWFRDADYPPEARRARQTGRVVVEVAIDAQGTIRGCTVTTSSGSAALDAATCELVRARGKFVPATDRKGAAAPGTYMLSTRWELRNTPLPGPWRAAAVMKIDSSGKVVSCENQASSQSSSSRPPLDFCAGAGKLSAAVAIQMRGGANVPGLVDVTFENAWSFDDETALVMAFEGEGRAVYTVRTVHFYVDPTGVARDCKIRLQAGPGQVNLCDPLPGPFEPIDRPRGITIKFAVSRPASG